jgi:hypothetical protein
VGKSLIAPVRVQQWLQTLNHTSIKLKRLELREVDEQVREIGARGDGAVQRQHPECIASQQRQYCSDKANGTDSNNS